jgi:4-amino-4-deoxy-L-arabinose transferase-like glycosyltransferase
MSVRLVSRFDSPFVIFIVAFATRLAAALYILKRYYEPGLLFIQNEPSHIAAALASGLGFSSPYAGAPLAPTAQQPPVYPFILAGLFKTFGIYTAQSAWAAVLLNILAGAATSVLLYKLGKAQFGSTAGIVAGWVWTLPWMYPAIAFSAGLSSPYLTALGLTAFVLWLLNVLKTDRHSFGLGMYGGLLVLLQPSLLGILIPYGLWLGFRKTRLRGVLLACAGTVVVIAPWTMRNYVALGRFVPIRDNFGLELWVGNHPGMQGTADFTGDFPDHDPSEYARFGEIRFMDKKWDEAKTFIAADRIAFVQRTLHRVAEFWFVPYSRLYLLLSLASWLGGVLTIRNGRNGWLWMTPLAFFPLVYYVTHVFSSYRHPIEPIMMLLAVYAFLESIPWVSRKLGIRLGELPGVAASP